MLKFNSVIRLCSNIEQTFEQVLAVPFIDNGNQIGIVVAKDSKVIYTSFLDKDHSISTIYKEVEQLFKIA